MADPPHGDPLALPRPYSKAFENFVLQDQDEEDLEGLIGYALYKQTVREQAGRGALTGNDRDPPPTMVETFRVRARQMLVDYSLIISESQRPEHEQTGLMNKLETVRLELIAELKRRTTWWGSILTNVAAWLVALAITIVVVTAWNKPDPAKEAVEDTRIAKAAATEAAQKALADFKAASPSGQSRPQR